MGKTIISWPKSAEIDSRDEIRRKYIDLVVCFAVLFAIVLLVVLQ